MKTKVDLPLSKEALQEELKRVRNTDEEWAFWEKYEVGDIFYPHQIQELSAEETKILLTVQRPHQKAV